MDLAKKRFKKQGFKTKDVEGYNLKNHPKIKRNHVVYLNLVDKVLPQIKKQNIQDGFLLAEDDAYVSDIITPNFLKERIKAKNGHKNIIRIGYQKVLAHSPPSTYPRGYYCVGTQLIWFPKNCIKDLEEVMQMKTPQHLNGFFSKDKELKKRGFDTILLDEDIQSGSKYNRYVREIEHHSITMDKTRLGKRESSINRNNKRKKTNNTKKRNRNNKNNNTKKRKFLFL